MANLAKVRKLADSNIKDEIWVMKDGTEIPVYKLDELHAKNILRMLIRNNSIDFDYDEDEAMLHFLHDDWGDRS